MLKSAGFQMISSSTLSCFLINQLRIFQIELLLIFHLLQFVCQVYMLYSINTRNGYERISMVLKLASFILVLINIYQVMQTDVRLCKCFWHVLINFNWLICNKTNFEYSSWFSDTCKLEAKRSNGINLSRLRFGIKIASK